jgi:SAM-dependent methyltransferase
MNLAEVTCPRCAYNIGVVESGVVEVEDNCSNCEFLVSKIEGIPNLRDCEEKQINLISKASTLPSYDSSNMQIPFIDRALQSDLLTLELGGGLDLCQNKNLIKSDAFLYSKDMHLIADAHSLPFADETFSFVYALAVFEHLHSPWIAADEIFRVLKPGGEVFVLTAFMQHEHGYPGHYFNMTRSGLERIFCNFEINQIKPSSHSSFDQLSYIFMDFVTFLNKVELENKLKGYKHKLEFAVKEFCKSVKDLDSLLLDENNISQDWFKIAPSIEITAKKK